MFGTAEEPPPARRERVPVHAIISLAALTALIFVLGVYPSPLWRMIQTISNAS
jgi:NADH:ubiquinone oxidoreductase subunit 4 (subunit M)